MGSCQESLEKQVKATRDPMLIKKRGEHEALLVDGLRTLSRGPLDITIPRWWSWSTGKPRRIPIEPIRLQLNMPDTLAARCLRHHLEPEHPVLVGHRESGEALEKYARLCGDFYGELVGDVNGLKIPIKSSWTPDALVLTPSFVDSLHDIGGQVVLGQGSGQELQYQIQLPGGGTSVSQLWYGAQCIAFGPNNDLGGVEDSHRRLCSTLARRRLVQQIRTVRQQYDELASALSQKIELMAHQRSFLPGPCEVCEAWGGLRA